MPERLCLTFLVAVTLFYCTVMISPKDICPEGTYTYYSKGQILCSACPNETYMPWKQHSTTICYPCTLIRDPDVEILMSACDGIHDSDIRCKKGYYRDLRDRNNPKCRKCSVCQDNYVQARQCQQFRDTQCCRDTNNNQEFDHQDADKCIGRSGPMVCYRGEYLDTTSNECKPCPDNTSMSKDGHHRLRCQPCQLVNTSDLPDHVTLIRRCGPTHQAKYGCEDGFHGNSSLSYRPRDFHCYPCRKCSDGMHIGRHCGMYEDTVCCDKPNMVGFDGPEGGACIRIGVMEIYPEVHETRLYEGDCQTLQCSIALHNMSVDITWTRTDTMNNEAVIHCPIFKQTVKENIIITTSTCKICDVTSENEGEFRCQARIGGNFKEAYTHVRPACKYGTYNPPGCDKNCSHNCEVSSASDDKDKNLCDHVSGTCLYGCRGDYTMPLCITSNNTDVENRSEESNHSTTVLIVIAVIGCTCLMLILLLLYTMYIMRHPVSEPNLARKIAAMLIFGSKRNNAGPKDPEKEPCIPPATQDEMQRLQADNGAKQDTIEKLENESKGQKDKIVELENESRGQKDKIEKLENQSRGQKDKIVELENESRGQKDKIVELENENRDQNDKIGELQNNEMAHKDKIKNLENENKKLLHEIRLLNNNTEHRDIKLSFGSEAEKQMSKELKLQEEDKEMKDRMLSNRNNGNKPKYEILKLEKDNEEHKDRIPKQQKKTPIDETQRLPQEEGVKQKQTFSPRSGEEHSVMPQSKSQAGSEKGYKEKMGVKARDVQDDLNSAASKDEPGHRTQQEDQGLQKYPQNMSEELGTTKLPSDEHLSLREKKVEGRLALKRIKKIQVFHSENCGSELQAILGPDSDDLEYRKEVGDDLARDGCAETVVKFLEEMTSFLHLTDEDIWSNTSIACAICCKYSTASQEFAKRLADKGATGLLICILNPKSYPGRTDEKRVRSMWEDSLTTLYCLAKLDGSKHDLGKQETVEILRHIGTTDKNLDNLVKLTLQQIADEDVGNEIQNDKENNQDTQELMQVLVK